MCADPRTVTTCIGVHVEPCRRYHQQLHFLRKCNRTDFKALEMEVC